MPAAGPTAAPSGTPTVTPTGAPTATPSPAASSQPATSTLVSGQPITIPAVGGFSGTVTYTAANGTSFGFGSSVTLQSFLSAPSGAPAPQALRQVAQRLRPFDLTPEATAYLQSIFTYSETLTGSLAVTIPGTTPGTQFTAETFDNNSGSLLASIQGIASGGGGTYTFTSVGQNYTVQPSHTYVTIIVANSNLTSSPSPGPSASASASPAPSGSPSATPGASASPSATPSASASPSATPSASASPSPSPTASAKPTASPTPSAAPSVTINEVTTQGQLAGIVLDGSVPYFTDNTNSAIGYLNAASQPAEFSVAGPLPAPIEGVFGLGGFSNPAIGPDGYLYFPHGYTNSIGRMNPANGIYADYPIPTASAGPTSLVTGPDGALWFSETGAGKIGRVTTSGSMTEFALPAGVGAMPEQIVVGPDGALWFTESGSGKIGRILTTATPASPNVTEFAMQEPGCLNIGLTSGPLNSLWYVGCYGYFSPAIDQVTTSAVQTLYPVPTALGAVDPRFLTTGADGAIWFTDQNANYIGRLAPAGNGNGTWTKYPYPLVHGNRAGNASANLIVAAPDGSLWWTEFNTGNVGHLIP